MDNTRDYARVSHSRQWYNYNVVAENEIETREIVDRWVDRRTAVFRVVFQLLFERKVLRLLFDGQRQVEKPVGVIRRDANALLHECTLVDLKADQREDRQHEH